MDAESDDNQVQAACVALDNAMIASGAMLQGVSPWDSDHPDVIAAWDALTQPQNLFALEARIAAHDEGRAMNQFAANVTRKAIAFSRDRFLR